MSKTQTSEGACEEQEQGSLLERTPTPTSLEVSDRSTEDKSLYGLIRFTLKDYLLRFILKPNTAESFLHWEQSIYHFPFMPSVGFCVRIFTPAKSQTGHHIDLWNSRVKTSPVTFMCDPDFRSLDQLSWVLTLGSAGFQELSKQVLRCCFVFCHNRICPLAV